MLEGTAFDRHFFCRRDGDKGIDNRLFGNPFEIVSLTTGQNGIGNLVGFRCRKNEENMIRRFFESLEKRIECTRRKHVHFVDDVHLALAAGRHEFYGLTNLSNLIDAIVAGAIDFEDIDGRTGPDFYAGGTGSTGLYRRALFAVQGLGQNPSARSLSYASASREEKGVSNSIEFDCVLERASDM
jgi:hypothetical protein